MKKIVPPNSIKLDREKPGRLRAHSDEFALEVGRFVHAFAYIESLTRSALTKLLKDPISEILQDLNFTKRVDILIAMRKGNLSEGAEGELWDEFVVLLNESKRLALNRNIFAHTFLDIDLHIDDEGENYVLGVIRPQKKSSQGIGLDQLRKERETVEKVSEGLHSTVYALASMRRKKA